MAFLISAFQIIGALSERSQQMRPPSNASFATADPRADGQADSHPRGAPRGAPARANLPPECATRVCAHRLAGVWGAGPTSPIYVWEPLIDRPPQPRGDRWRELKQGVLQVCGGGG